jgi:natural product biosynthesis luciferase-like monooxygenase protein
MKCGLFFVPVLQPGESAHAAYESIFRQTELAESSGFDSVWLSEHHGDEYGGSVPSPAVLASAIAARTSHMRIGVAAAIVPFHSRLRLAEDFAMVDVLSSGRLEMGFGRGFLPHELRAFGVDANKSQAILIDGVRAIEHAWTTGLMSAQGEESSGSVRVLPRTLQKPRPAIWIAASTSKASFEFAGSYGFHLMINPYTRTDEEIAQGIDWYKAAAHTAGYDNASCRVMAHLHLYVCTRDGDASEEPREALRSYLHSVANAYNLAARTRPQQSTPLSYEKLYPHRVAFGTTDAVIETIERWRARGITDLCLMSQFGNLPLNLALRSIDLFATRVLPHVRR